MLGIIYITLVIFSLSGLTMIIHYHFERQLILLLGGILLLLLSFSAVIILQQDCLQLNHYLKTDMSNDASGFECDFKYVYKVADNCFIINKFGEQENVDCKPELYQVLGD